MADQQQPPYPPTPPYPQGPVQGGPQRPVGAPPMGMPPHMPVPGMKMPVGMKVPPRPMGHPMPVGVKVPPRPAGVPPMGMPPAGVVSPYGQPPLPPMSSDVDESDVDELWNEGGDSVEENVDENGKLIPMEKALGRKKSLRAIVAKLAEKIVDPEHQIIGISHGELMKLRGHKRFDAAYRECCEIRKDYLIDRALDKRFDPSFVKHLISEEEAQGGDFSLKIEVTE